MSKRPAVRIPLEELVPDVDRVLDKPADRSGQVVERVPSPADEVGDVTADLGDD